MLDLEKFCEPSMKKISRPWSAGDYTYATNGHIAVRVPRMDDAPENEEAPDMARVPWDHETLNDWEPLPPYDLAGAKDCTLCKGMKKARVCHECDGEGEVTAETDYNYYVVTCKTCGGDGTMPGESDDPPCPRCQGTGRSLNIPVPWAAGHIGMQMLVKINDLPGVKLSKTGDGEKPWRFIFDGGAGVIMPMRA